MGATDAWQSDSGASGMKARLVCLSFLLLFLTKKNANRIKAKDISVR